MLAGAASAAGMWLFDLALHRAVATEAARMLVLLGGAAVFVVLPALLFVVGREYLAHWRAGAQGTDYGRETRAALRRGVAWFVGGGVALLLLSSLKDLHAAA
jgi:hypothetical protein